MAAWITEHLVITVRIMAWEARVLQYCTQVFNRIVLIVEKTWEGGGCRAETRMRQKR